MDRQTDPSDLTDAQWETIRAVLPAAKGGRTEQPRLHLLREIWDAIFYQTRTGCAWRYLPHDFPPHGDVWEHFCRWCVGGLIVRVHDTLRERARVQAGHDLTPSATTPTATRRGRMRAGR